MKMRVFFLKRKSVYYFLLLSLILITLLTTIKYKNTSAFNLLNSNKTIRKDLTGDGNEDSVNINSKDNKYSITIKSQNKNYTLKNNENKKFNKEITIIFGLLPLILKIFLEIKFLRYLYNALNIKCLYSIFLNGKIMNLKDYTHLTTILLD